MNKEETIDEANSVLLDYLKSESKSASELGRFCRSLLDMKPSEMIRQITTWCESKIPRNQDDHKDYCEKCGNGKGFSELYHCDFCTNSIHHECLGCSRDMFDTCFVCEYCMIDLLQALI